MRNKIYTLIAAVAFFAGCKNDRPTDCTFPNAPKMDEVHLSVINYTDYKDLLVSGKFEPDSIRVIQPCSPSTPITITTGSATRTDSDIVVRSIGFKGLTSFADLKDCQKIAIWWSNNDLDTMQFVMEQQRCAGNCCMSYYPRIIIDGQVISPSNGIEGEEVMHFLLLKTVAP
jgi:hypothetical protein